MKETKLLTHDTEWEERERAERLEETNLRFNPSIDSWVKNLSTAADHLKNAIPKAAMALRPILHKRRNHYLDRVESFKKMRGDVDE